MKVRVLREAEEEIGAAADFYAREASVVAARFLGEVDAALERIARHPRSYARVDRRFRGCVLGRFPYTMIYTIAEQEVMVLAMAHQSRRPGYWRDRLPAQ